MSYTSQRELLVNDKSYGVAIINVPKVNNPDPICGADGKKLIFDSI
tara:strand:+ start:8585 stop:8722 length:138 start_codon:yes stop_codon:yes gene_type:complete